MQRRAVPWKGEHSILFPPKADLATEARSAFAEAALEKTMTAHRFLWSREARLADVVDRPKVGEKGSSSFFPLLPPASQSSASAVAATASDKKGSSSFFIHSLVTG